MPALAFPGVICNPGPNRLSRGTYLTATYIMLKMWKILPSIVATGQTISTQHGLRSFYARRAKTMTCVTIFNKFNQGKRE